MTNGCEIIETMIAQRLKNNPEIVRDIDAKVAIELTGKKGGRWIIDCTKQPATVKKSVATKAATTIIISEENLVKLSHGELNAITAFMFGKIKIDGDMAIATKLGKILTESDL